MGRVLLHVGYPKTGSSLLQERWFPQHPQLHYTHGGIGGFRSIDELMAFVLSDSRPVDSLHFVVSSEHLSMPFTDPGESLGVYDVDKLIRHVMFNGQLQNQQARICQLLKGLFPDSFVLIVLRGFAGMIPSMYSQYVRVGGVLSAQAHFQPYWELLPELLDYNYLIQLYVAAFGSQNVLVMPYELLRDDPRQFLGWLETSLGISHWEMPIERINPGLSPATLYWYPRISRTVMAFSKRMGPTVHSRVARWYVQQMMTNKLELLVRVLKRVTGRQTPETDFSFVAENLFRFAGKATTVRDNPLFAAYAADYLFD